MATVFVCVKLSCSHTAGASEQRRVFSGVLRNLLRGEGAGVSKNLIARVV